MPNLKSIERVWEVHWKMQLEKSFLMTWQKRVDHLYSMISKEKVLSLETRAFLTGLTKCDKPKDIPFVDKFSVSETELLNKFKKKKSSSAMSKDALERRSSVILGERMLGQVQKSWKTIGCKKSQNMLENALSKIKDFMKDPAVKGLERVQYENLADKLRSFKSYLLSKEDNPFDLDYNSISEITTSFNYAELLEYIQGVIQTKGILDTNIEDIKSVCQRIQHLQKLKYDKNNKKKFVRGDILNRH